MKTINKGFERLRQVVPYARDDRRHSKVETLRLAIEYIRNSFTLGNRTWKSTWTVYKTLTKEIWIIYLITQIGAR